MIKKPIIKLITLFTIVLTVYGIGFSIFTLNALRPSSDNVHKADASIILTGGENRIKEGLKHVTDKDVKYAFISGVSKNNTLIDIVPKKTYNAVKCCVILGSKAQDTIGNAQESFDWLATNEKVKTFNIVTSTYHMPRASYIFKQHSMAHNYKITTYVVAMERLTPDKREFWNLMFNEYNKLIYTWVMLKG